MSRPAWPKVGSRPIGIVMTKLDKPDKVPAQCDVVVVNYNAGDFLIRCVESVLCSDVPVRLIVVDNDSSDHSLDQLKGLETGAHHIDIVNNGENHGFSKAVNIGARRGNAAHILLLNPDCEIHPHTIRNLLAEVQYCKNMGILGALVFNEDGTEQRGCRRLEPTFVRSMVTALRLGKYFQSVNMQHEALPDKPQQIDAVSGASMLIDRSVFDALGGMDEGYFLHVEDLDMCRRVRESGKKVYFTPNVSLFHHHGASSHAVPYRTEWHKHQGMLRYQNKFQRPNQSALRSHITRGFIYINFALSIVRKQLSRSHQQASPVRRMISDRKPVVITGASSDLGQAVLAELKSEPSIIAVSRGSTFPALVGHEQWFSWSFFEKVPTADFQGMSSWLALSPVWSAPELAQTLARFGPIERVIGFSSTSIEGKAHTANEKERVVVQQLIEGEKGLLAWGNDHEANVTLCRASMIYGGSSNQNIAFVKTMIRRFRFFPMLSHGNGLRQPVHVNDLAVAVRRMLDTENLSTRTYVLAGGEQLSYRQMICRVFGVLGVPPRLWVWPQGVFMRLLDILSVIPGLGFLNREMVKRLEQDMVYDIEPARRDFSYAPGMFRPE
jgi:GT2 family glycosyltransferase